MKFQRLYAALSSGGLKGHFGQWAEDVLVRKLFFKEKKTGLYVDLGAYHPFVHSNTAYLWLKGWKGVNVDANPKTIELFQKQRPQDINVWAALVPQNEFDAGVREVSLHLPPKPDLSSGVSATGSVLKELSTARGLDKTIKVPAKTVSQVMGEARIQKIDYLNIDIEGFDLVILKEFNIDLHCPDVVSVEDYSGNVRVAVASEITLFMENKGYSLVGRAGPTSIFQMNNN